MYARPIAPLIVCLVVVAACQAPRSNRTVPVQPAYFPAAEVCSYPASGPGKLFNRLSEGTWTLSDPTAPTGVFRCSGGTSVVQLFGDGNSTVEVEYIATGVEKGAEIVSLTYIAAGTHPIPNESTFRRAFGNLVSAIALRGLGSATPELFKKKLENLASYSRPGERFTENFDIGRGFISLTREASPNEIKVYVKIFPDIALKLE